MATPRMLLQIKKGLRRLDPSGQAAAQQKPADEAWHQMLKRLDADNGEIKSMRTADALLRRGVAARMLDHIIDEARRRGLARLSLETGSGAAFEPAIALYRRYGFDDCAPFADYKPDPFSRFMTRVV